MPKQTPAQRAWYERNRDKQIAQVSAARRKFVAELAAMKAEAGCSNCSESDPVCLDFHHVNPDEKEFNICTGIARGFGRAKMLREVAKCVVLCANCHRKKHAAVV
jgi:5-methylcytosine-specific restriction endonuclease McrA